MTKISLEPIGVIRSAIKDRKDAPCFYTEGAPNAVLEINPAYTDGLHRMRAGDEIIVITWLHQADRKYSRSIPEGTSRIPLREYFRRDHRTVRIRWGCIE
jgi:tRNA (Thr-GGU) A37 N-methylase